MSKEFSAPIHWHEGLFLQPHHLQYLQRQISNQVIHERRLGWAYPHGVIESKLSPDALENMLIRFDRLRVVMPSGLEVHIPDNADLPALDIKRPFEAGADAFTVSLGVPLWYANRGNTIDQISEDDWRVKRLYRVSEIDQPDENTGENPRPVQIRRVNARLLLDEDDRTDLEVLPLLRISHATGEDVGLPQQDPEFVPSCLVLSGSPTLRDMVRDLAHQVEATRRDVVFKITRAGFSVDTMRGAQFEQMLRLRTLNRFSSSLPHLIQAPGISPFEVYLQLRELLGELAALHPDRDPFDAPVYDHDNPSLVFKELTNKIRAFLPGAGVASFLKLAFARDGKDFIATLTDDHLNKPNAYFLGIKTKEDPRKLAQLVEDAGQFKFMAKSKKDTRVFGVRLSEERHPPLQLPAQVGMHYYRLHTDSRMWGLILDEKEIAIRWPGSETADFEITLFMTVPDEETSE